MPDGRARVLALTGAGVLSQVGMTALVIGLSFGKAPPPAPPAAVQAAAPGHADAAPSPESTGEPVPGWPRSRPMHLSAPRVGIETELIELRLQPDGTVEVPPDGSNSPAGWYADGVSPGESGSAVFIGHLDAPDANAVFFNLGAMRPGDRIWVTRADHSTLQFVVQAVGSYPREEFPTTAVYGPSNTPVLRLVTCGGVFLRGWGYTRNVVVFADLDPASLPATPAVAPPAEPTEPTAAGPAGDPTVVPADPTAVPADPSVEPTVRPSPVRTNHRTLRREPAPPDTAAPPDSGQDVPDVPPTN